MHSAVVLVTAKDEPEAERIARDLLEKKLAACCNLIKGVRSLYHWEGKLCDDQEVLLVIKTRRDAFEALSLAVKACHSYTTPEIILLPVEAGDAAYLKWLNDSIVV
jgi:periplasmic divalent cation tolerance protein